MVLAAKQRSLYELTDAISAKDRVRALEILDATLSTGDGDEAAIGHLYMLAKTFPPDARHPRAQRPRPAHALGRALARLPRPTLRRRRHHPPGPPLQSKRELTRAIRLVAKADLALRSNPPGKRLILEKLILDLAGGETKIESAGGWMQEELPV